MDYDALKMLMLMLVLMLILMHANGHAQVVSLPPVAPQRWLLTWVAGSSRLPQDSTSHAS